MPMTAPQDGQAQLQQLMQMLQQKNSAQANLSGFDDSYAQAEALRDAPNRGAQTGGVMGGLADILRGNTANKRLRELGPQRQQARQKIAGVQDATEIYGLQRSLAKQAAEKSRYDATAAESLRRYELGETEKTNKRSFDLTSADQKAAAKVREAALERDFEADEAAKDRVSREKRASIKANKKYKGIQPTVKERGQVEGYKTSIGELKNIIGKYNDDWGGSATGLPTGGMEMSLARMGLAPDSLERKEEWFALVQSAKEMKDRHEMFGATLSPGEQKAWKSALTVDPNMSTEQINNRLNEAMGILERAARNKARNGLRYGWNRAWLGDNLGRGVVDEEAGYMDLDMDEELEDEFANKSLEELQRMSDEEG